MKIPTTVITGFLGAGKTTLIRHLMENAGGRKIALIINEFGDLGIDRELVTGCGIEGCSDDDVVELANGCICCTVADDFLPVMEALVNRAEPPDHIVIETSGLALPKPLVKAFHWPEIRSRATVDGVVVVIDGPAFEDGHFAHDVKAVQAQREADESLDHDNPLEEVFTDQLGAADMVLLNKCDQTKDLEHTKAHLAEHLRDGVHVVETSFGKIDAAVLLGIDAAAEDDLEARHSHHDHDHDHDHDDFETFILELPTIDDAKAFEVRLTAAITDHNILRVKGFLDIPGKPMRQVVQAVGPRIERYFDRAWNSDERASRLVIIGQHGLDQAAISTAITGS